MLNLFNMDKQLTNYFCENMYQKSVHEVDKILQSRFNQKATDNYLHTLRNFQIAELMHIAYLNGVRACLTDKSDYLSLSDKLKSMMQ